MPKLSDTMTEGTLVRWKKKPGETVSMGEVIAEVETDKATMEMEAFEDGVLSELFVAEGQKVQVGQKIARIGDAADPVGAAVPTPAAAAGSDLPPTGNAADVIPQPDPPAAGNPGAAQPPTGTASALEAAPTPGLGTQGAGVPGTAGAAQRIKASPLARKLAQAHGVDLTNLRGTGPGERIVRRDVLAAAPANGGTPPTAPDRSPKASPAGLPAASPRDPAKGVGGPGAAAPFPAAAPSPSGAAGVAAAVEHPVEAAAPASAAPAASAPPAVPAAPAPAPKAAPAPVTVGSAFNGTDQKIPLSGMRKTIADRLLASKTQIPHFYLHVEVDAGPLVRLRQEINAAGEQDGNKFSVNDFVLKAAVAALERVPRVNASFQPDHFLQYGTVNLAVAVAVEDGLVTPVIRDAQRKSLREISLQVKDLALRARNKKLKPDEYQGGTFTVSNLGSYGIDAFDAIINPPQAAILSVGAIVKKPVVGAGDELVVGQRMSLGLSCDHRVVDGAVGAEYLAALRRLVEHPLAALV